MISKRLMIGSLSAVAICFVVTVAATAISHTPAAGGHATPMKSRVSCFNYTGCTGYIDDLVVNDNLYSGFLNVGDEYLYSDHMTVGSTYLDSSSISTGTLSVGSDTSITSTTVSTDNLEANEVDADIKNFRIDDPLDPANKYLFHSSVESPDMKDMYDGVVTLDASGTAWISLPKWFSSLNGDFRYQLTPIGGAASLYVAQEISDERFEIAGGKAQQRVSWQVTGIRHDPSALRHRAALERDKKPSERGRYVDPVAYGQPEAASVFATPPRPASHLKPTQAPSSTANPMTIVPNAGGTIPPRAPGRSGGGV